MFKSADFCVMAAKWVFYLFVSSGFLFMLRHIYVPLCTAIDANPLGVFIAYLNRRIDEQKQKIRKTDQVINYSHVMKESFQPQFFIFFL